MPVNNTPGKSSRVLLAAALALLLSPLPAAAYIGPGLGAGTIGVVLGLVGSVFLALFAFFWYPIKRVLFGNKARDKEEDEPESHATQEVSSQVDSSIEQNGK